MIAMRIFFKFKQKKEENLLNNNNNEFLRYTYKKVKIISHLMSSRKKTSFFKCNSFTPFV